MSGTPAKASRWCRELGEARGRPSCLKLEEEKMEVKLGEAHSSKKEDEVKAVQLVDVDLRRPPAMLRRGGGVSMVVEMMELLHGLSERESVLWSEWECERERAGGCSGEGELGLTRGPEWGHVALNFCAFDTHLSCQTRKLRV